MSLLGLLSDFLLDLFFLFLKDMTFRCCSPAVDGYLGHCTMCCQGQLQGLDEK